jgi:hypothetical protein
MFVFRLPSRVTRPNWVVIFVVSVVCLVSTNAQNNSSWSGCVGGNSVVQIGKTTRVCLQIGNTTDWTAGVGFVRASFEPEADQYSRFHIPECTYEETARTKDAIAFKKSPSSCLVDLLLPHNKCFKNAPCFFFFFVGIVIAYINLVQNPKSPFGNTNITVGAASQQSLSFLRVYYDMVNKRIFPYLTAIINVDKGTVKGITWDDACVFCGGLAEACLENTYNFTGGLQTQQSARQPTKACWISKNDCDAAVKQGGGNSSSSTTSSLDSPEAVCDVKLYVVWSGTDTNGKALQSQAYRFSQFPVQELTDAITKYIPDFGLAEPERH